MKNMIYVFVGDPMTGKSILGRAINGFEVVDDFSIYKYYPPYDDSPCKKLISKIIDNKHDYIIICNDRDHLHRLTDRLKLLSDYYNITVCDFRRLGK